MHTNNVVVAHNYSLAQLEALKNSAPLIFKEWLYLKLIPRFRKDQELAHESFVEVAEKAAEDGLKEAESVGKFLSFVQKKIIWKILDIQKDVRRRNEISLEAELEADTGISGTLRWDITEGIANSKKRERRAIAHDLIHAAAPRLTKKENLLLEAIALGMEPRDIAEKLKWRVETYYVRKSALFRKFKAILQDLESA